MELPIQLKTKLRILGVLPWPNIKTPIVQWSLVVLFAAILIDSVVFTLWFIKWDAETFGEFAQAGIGCVVGVFYSMIYARVIWQRNEFARIIDQVEQRISSSECFRPEDEMQMCIFQHFLSGVFRFFSEIFAIY